MHKNHNKTELVLVISEDKYRQIFENSNETFENQPNKFDLVLTDQIMPNMTGELAQTIRKTINYSQKKN